MFDLLVNVLVEARALITNGSTEERIIVAVLAIVVVAVLVALMQALYLLTSTLHRQMLDKETFVLPMLLDSPVRLFLCSIFCLFIFLLLTYAFSVWMGHLWGTGK